MKLGEIRDPVDDPGIPGIAHRHLDPVPNGSERHRPQTSDHRFGEEARVLGLQKLHQHGLGHERHAVLLGEGLEQGPLVDEPEIHQLGAQSLTNLLARGEALVELVHGDRPTFDEHLA